MRKVDPPSGMRPVIHALLRPRWDLEPKALRFLTGRREFVPGENLPSGTQIQHLVSRLQNVDRENLSAVEKKLSRWIQLILPQGTEAEHYVAEMQSWPCFEEVHVAPRPSLPSPGG